MSSAKIIKLKTKSVKNIQKITDALEKIAVAKIPKLSSCVKQANLYYSNLHDSCVDVFSSARLSDKMISSPFLFSGDISKVLFLCITSNRGLCGPYNSYIWSTASDLTNKIPGYDVEYYVVGKKGIKSAKFNNLKLHKTSIDFKEDLVYEYVDDLADYLSDLFLNREYRSIYLIYNFYSPGIGQKARYELLFPLDENSFISKVPVFYNNIFTFDFDMDLFIKKLFNALIRARLFYVFLQSVLSENVARSVAMKQAYNAAKDIASNLMLQYNKIRQNKVTNEIIEIMSASNISS